MAEDHNDRENNVEKESLEKKSDIIELTDIAIGITPEDDAIVEQTEDLIGEAFIGFAGATSEVIDDDERRLDLSETTTGINATADKPDVDTVSEPDDVTDQIDMDDENLEEDISQELDNYFGTDDKPPVIQETTLINTPKPTDESDLKPVDTDDVQLSDINISSNRLDDAIERVIRKMFAEKINRILDDVIERTVSEEISQLKDYLLGVSGKK